MTDAVLAEAAALSERGDAFVLATVVAAGTVVRTAGFQGAHPRRRHDAGVVGRRLRPADGPPRGPDIPRRRSNSTPSARAARRGRGGLWRGVVVVPMECGSEGALAVSLEPVVPTPLVVAIGRSPAVDTLTSLTRGLGWRAVVVESSEDLASQPVDRGTAVVVATQGHDDETALQAALRTPAGYVGLVASRKRSASTLGYLRDRGVSEADLSRVQAPAGLDLGATDHREIAVAILAELVGGALGASCVPQSRRLYPRQPCRNWPPIPCVE